MKYNPNDAATKANPYPIFKQMRDEAPVYKLDDALFDSYVLTRYEDIRAVYVDNKHFSNNPASAVNTEKGAGQGQRLGVKPVFPRSIVFMDEPEHTRLRRLASSWFTPRSVAAWRPRIEAITRELFEMYDGTRTEFDIVHDLARPLTTWVIAEITGVPTSDRALYAKWSDDILSQVTADSLPEHIEQKNRSGREIREYLRDRVNDARRSGGNPSNVIGALMQASDGDDKLTEEEMLDFLILLIVAGNETTRNLIGNGAVALAQHPDQYQLIRERPDLIPAAVEEMLRYDAPAQMTNRYPMQPVTLHGVEIPAGSHILLAIASANRDERQFADPDRFVVQRENNEHLAFIIGAHYCIGAPLARLETVVAYEAIVERFPALELGMAADQLPILPVSHILRGRQTIPVAPPRTLVRR